MKAHLVVRARPGAVLVARSSSIAVAVASAVPQVMSWDSGRRFVVLAGLQGPKGNDGTDGVAISPDADNQLETRPNGLYAAPASWAALNW
ncbi:hypothetical protein [Pseudomonas sp. USHLN015]|uniref:hypothetical protein n=1 Tax=Pseudomonas sp. USHLN015 TaxID=3081296 RepID=UPI00301D36B2